MQIKDIYKAKLLLNRVKKNSKRLIFMSNEIRVGFDYSHNNMLTFEASSYADFIQFLFASGYKLGKIEAGFYSSEKLEEYDVIIMSTPRNMELNPIEIEIIEDYVKKGGGLLIVSSRGGDHLNKTNLNDLCQKFGFRFESDEINDSVNYVNLQKRPLISKFRPHFISDQVHNVVFSSACSLSVLDFLEDDKFLRITEIVKSGLNTWRNRFDGTDWIEEDSPKIPLLVATEYHKGKVVAFGTLSIFSSLNREYGFAAYDNDVVIANILTWLTTDVIGEGKVITVDLSLDLFHWADYLIKEEDWENFYNHVDLFNAEIIRTVDNFVNKYHAISCTVRTKRTLYLNL